MFQLGGLYCTIALGFMLFDWWVMKRPDPRETILVGLLWPVMLYFALFGKGTLR